MRHLHLSIKLCHNTALLKIDHGPKPKIDPLNCSTKVSNLTDGVSSLNNFKYSLALLEGRVNNVVKGTHFLSQL